MRTYWLYEGERVIGSARAPDQTPAETIIRQVLASHDRVPLIDPDENPWTRRLRLARAEVRV